MRPGVDYSMGDSAVSEIQAGTEAAADYGFNALFVPIVSAGSGQTGVIASALAGESEAGGDGDLFEEIIAACHDNGLLCYAVFSLNAPLGTPLDLTSPSGREEAYAAMSGLVRSYDIDGLILEDAALHSDLPPDYTQYLAYGGGMGMDAYRRHSVTAAVRETIAAAHALRPNLPVGLSAPAVWETAEHTEGGLASDGGQPHSLCGASADTLGWLNSGLFRFALIQNNRLCAYDDASLSFSDVANWWRSSVTNEGVSLALLHDTNLSGRTPDELCRQAVQGAERSFQGSVFSSLRALRANHEGETSALVRYLKGEIDGSSTGAELTLSSPTKTTFTTYESSVAIVGSCDPAFPLTLNGKEISCNSKGFFSVQQKLSPGNNEFRLSNKGKDITLTITYQQLLLRDISPTKPLSVDGSSKIAVSAIAKRGAKVTVTLRSTTVQLAPSPGNVDEKNSDYATYTGVLTMPAATDLAQNMGNLTFTASYQGGSETKTGGRITVARKMIPTEELQLGNFAFDESLPLGRWGYVAEIRSEQAETFDAQLLDDRSRSTNSYLPKGTIDYCSDGESVYTQGSSIMKYRTLDYGKRVYSSTDNSSGVKEDYLNLYYRQLPTQNALSVAKVSSDARHTTLTLNTQWKAPFTVTLSPQGYRDPYPASGAPDYAVDSTTYTTLDIHFAYSVSGQGAIDLTDDPVFRSAEWIRNTDGTYTLRMHLRKTGQFYGWGCNYNNDGQLVFSFLHPFRLSEASNPYGVSLKGSVIVLDAGHGGNNPGATARFGGKQYYEDEMNFALTCRVQDLLESLGATVILTRETDVDMSLYDRTVKTRRAKPDLMISLHRNSSVSTSGYGFESYYYQPYSMPFCRAVNDPAAPLFRQNRGIHYITPMYVTRISECPAILIECGYMSNADDMSSMIQNSFDQALAEKVVQGVVDDFRSIQ